MTPQPLNQLLTNAEQGNLQTHADLFCDTEERGSHICSELDKRKKGVNGLDLTVNLLKNATDQPNEVRLNDGLPAGGGLEDLS